MKTIIESKKVTLIEKNSIFIGRAFFVHDQKEVKEFLNILKTENKGYSHIVYAYRFTKDEFYYTDDKEPKNSAGLPVFNVLDKNDLYFTLLTVIRFFGGIKLGASGLVRAYSKCAIETVKNSKIKKLEKFYLFEFSFGYQDYNEFLYFIKQVKHKILEEKFTEKITIKIYLEENLKEKVEKLFPNSFKILEKDVLLPY
ncbi:MAG: YigZ family protein [candidate division WOR-3 bacterium]